MTPGQIRTSRTTGVLSQQELGNRLGVSQGTVSNWERGRASPTAAQMRQLTALLAPDADSPATREGDAAFGTWVRDQRLRRGMSVAQLAGLSGISMPQLYNIESGRTANPRPTTRRSLERHFGGIPAEVQEAAREEFVIPNVGEMTGFDPHSAADFPDEAGVYVLYDISDRPVYVGQSGNIKDRIRNPNTGHVDKFWYRSPIVETAAYVRVVDENLRKQLKQTLIKFLRSKRGHQQEERGSLTFVKRVSPAGAAGLNAQMNHWAFHNTVWAPKLEHVVT